MTDPYQKTTLMIKYSKTGSLPIEMSRKSFLKKQYLSGNLKNRPF